ncbi:MAG TPA: nitrilase-related carbon-nitrogen hydrolase, partial [Gammaproteobacteria bacterium]|nr:nitrilase-related carbon-nitrogen hydrolase [Gammaproteobacteria bacterium]
MSTEATQLEALLVQPELRWQDASANRGHLEQLVAGGYASARGADSSQARLIVLPETFTTSFLGDQGMAPESMDGETVPWMKGIAERYDAAIA